MARAIWIVRHASRLDFEDPTWFRSARRPHDPPLSPRGGAEARLLARRLASEPVAHLFASPFLRAVETAAPLAETLGLPIALEPGLSEWLNAAWFPREPSTLPLEDLARRFPCIDRAYATARRRALGRERRGGAAARGRHGAASGAGVRRRPGRSSATAPPCSVPSAVCWSPRMARVAKAGARRCSPSRAPASPGSWRSTGRFVLAMAPDTSHLLGDGRAIPVPDLRSSPCAGIGYPAPSADVCRSPEARREDARLAGRAAPRAVAAGAPDESRLHGPRACPEERPRALRRQPRDLRHRRAHGLSRDLRQDAASGPRSRGPQSLCDSGLARPADPLRRRGRDARRTAPSSSRRESRSSSFPAAGARS